MDTGQFGTHIPRLTIATGTVVKEWRKGAKFRNSNKTALRVVKFNFMSFNDFFCLNCVARVSVVVVRKIQKHPSSDVESS